MNRRKTFARVPTKSSSWQGHFLSGRETKEFPSGTTNIVKILQKKIQARQNVTDYKHYKAYRKNSLAWNVTFSVVRTLNTVKEGKNFLCAGCHVHCPLDLGKRGHVPRNVWSAQREILGDAENQLFSNFKPKIS